MQIITVAPIVRGVLKEHLTYFSKENLEIGMVIKVPVRTREIPAIVLNTSKVSESKSILKSSDFMIRKITKAKPRRIWSTQFLKSAEYTANYSVKKLGETLLTLTPATILDALINGGIDEPKSNTPPRHPELFATQADTKTRIESYQRLVRESFVHNDSVFICLPSQDDVLRVSEILSHGIEEYTLVFHSNVTRKKILERWGKIAAEKHAVLAIGTPQYLGLPHYFKTIVLDEEHSHGWKTMTHPVLDMRIFVEKYAHECGSDLIFGAPLLRAETYARVKKGIIAEYSHISARTLSESETIMVDPRKEEKEIRENTGRREFIMLTKEAEAMITDAQSNHENTFLLASRKGLSPVTSCGDCGTIVRCPQCDNPLVIHKKELLGQRTQIFVCHACGFMRAPENNVNEVCPNCNGWRLQGLGIGIDRIENEVSKLFPNAPLFILDGDHAKTKTQAKNIIAQFEKSQGGVLIATPMAIPLISATKNAIIISIDSLFAIPNIQMSERIFALILAIREKVVGKFLIQTRADDTTIFEQALRGDLINFADSELELRKAFEYPPFGTIIKITLRSKRTDIAGEMERLKNFLDSYNPIIPGTMTKEPKNIYKMVMILKLPIDTWPKSELIKKLQTLPHQFSIEVNPDHLL